MTARTVLITGASAGIGKSCAEQFSARGDDLILVARRGNLLTATKRELEARYKNKIHVIACDLSNENALQQMAQEHQRLLAQVDVLVNNAGIVKGWAPFFKSHAKDWQAVFDTNVKAVLFMIQKVVPGMVARGKGHIINLGSVAGRWNYPNDAVYCASKHALRALSETLRFDLQGTGVRVTTVEPGPVNTDLTEVRHGSKAIAEKAFLGWQPLLPEDIAEIVVWASAQPQNVNALEVVVFPLAQSAIFMTDKGPPPEKKA